MASQRVVDLLSLEERRAIDSCLIELDVENKKQKGDLSNDYIAVWVVNFFKEKQIDLTDAMIKVITRSLKQNVHRKIKKLLEQK